MDKIILNGIQVMGICGVNPLEKIVKQPFLIDVELYLDLSAAETSDTISDTLDYSNLYVHIRDLVINGQWNLLEAMAGAICRLMLSIELVQKVKVRVEKTQARMGSVIFPVKIELTREKEQPCPEPEKELLQAEPADDIAEQTVLSFGQKTALVDDFVIWTGIKPEAAAELNLKRIMKTEVDQKAENAPQ